MPPLPLAARVVEVIADRGSANSPRYLHGSGCLVARQTVLTAAHVVTGAARVRVRDPNKVVYEATLDERFVGDAEGPRPDLALLEVPGIDPVPPIGLAAVNRDSPTGDPVERCHAIGYPAFMEVKVGGAGPVRDTVDAIGQVSVLSRLAGGMLSVQVSSAPRQLPPERVALGDSEWSGMSGAPLIADGTLLGVVTEHAPREGPSAITVTPLTALEADPAHPGWGPGVADPGAWWERLRVSGTAALSRLPARRQRAEPAYWATVREIHRRTELLVGRPRDLSEIASFAAGAEGYRWLVGGAWAGKTSLLAEAVTAGLPDQVDVVSYFLSRREADADSDRFLVAVIPQLAYLLDEDAPTVDLHQFRALWQRVAERARVEERQLLLVVDGLDEDLRPPGLPSVAAFLPSVAGGRTHVLVASRPHPELPNDLPGGHPLASTPAVELEPFAGAQELARRARQEIDGLIVGDRAELAVDVLGLLAAAAGPLALEDLATMTEAAPRSGLTRQIRRLLTAEAARSLQPVGPADARRYQFAHESLLEHAQSDADLSDPEFRRRIHRWAQAWRDADWPPAVSDKGETPRYLLDTYPSTLAREPRLLAQLVTDVGWVAAAIEAVGVDRVLIDLRRAAAADATQAAVGAMLATVTGQAHHLRRPRPLDQPGYLLRQLWMQAAELAEDSVANDVRARLRSTPGAGLVPQWTTRRTSRALSGELGRHDERVSAVAVLPDGRVVSGGDDGRVLVWDPAAPDTGPAELGRHDGPVSAVAVLPDGRVLSGGYDPGVFSGRFDGRVLVWDPAAPDTGPTELGRHDGPVAVWAVAVLPDGRVLSGGYDWRVLVWDPAAPDTGPTELGRHDGPVSAVAVLPDGRVVSGDVDGRVLVWDPAAPDTGPTELGRHDDRVLAVAVLPDGRVVSGQSEGRVLVWDPAAPDTGPAELGRHDDRVSVWALAVLPDGRVVSGGTAGRVLVWDPAASDTEPAELGRHDGWVAAVAVLPDGRVLSGGSDRRVLVWDPAAPDTEPAELDRHDGWVSAVAVLADGRVVSGDDDGRVLVWDPAAPDTGPTELGRHDDRVSAVAVLPDGRVVSGDVDGRVLVWDPAAPDTGPTELGRHDERVSAVAVLPDGRVVSGGDDGRVLVWDPAAPDTEPAELGMHEGSVLAVAVLPDGRVVSSGYDGRVLVWDPAAPDTEPAELGMHDGLLLAVAVLPDGRVVSGGTAGRVLVWDPAAPDTEPAELGRHDGSVSAVAVLPDGRVVSGDDQQVVLWDVTTRTEIAQLACSLTALATRPNGRGASSLVVAHAGAGFSLWSYPCPQE